MTMTLNTGRQEGREAREASKAAPFRFAPTFVIDLIFSSAYVISFIQLWAHVTLTISACAIAGLIGFALALCYIGKVLIIASLDRRGGDARTYVISSDLVTDGLYAYSRNPTYLLTLIQCGVWSTLLVFLQAFAPFEPLLVAFSILLPILFFLVTDRVITREDAALRAAHPQAFDDYSKQVGRWFGRKRGALSGPAN
jgi:protein-S-isoprenylcysteine O-methyltransferase Ste14